MTPFVIQMRNERKPTKGSEDNIKEERGRIKYKEKSEEKFQLTLSLRFFLSDMFRKDLPIIYRNLNIQYWGYQITLLR